jgi:hypothetical protein
LHNINFQQLSTQQALAIADGLAQAEHYDLAAQAYRSLLRAATAADQVRIRVRLGLAQAPKARTPAMLSTLHTLEAGLSGVFVGECLATWEKTLPFFEDARFIELADRHADLLPVPNWHWNLQTALWAVQKTQGVAGDFVELGVFKGHTTLFCAEYVGFADWPKRWFLYDTFDGIPEDQLDEGWAEKNKAVYSESYSFEEVRDRFAQMPNVTVVQGRVPEVLADTSPERIAFLHVDLNNSTAEVQALDVLFDRVTSGGVILFDDYGWLSSRAQRDAERAWFAARGLHILSLPTGQGLFIKD